MKNAKPGERFGRLTVLGDEYQTVVGRRVCVCVCGDVRQYFASNLVRGMTTSCGCRRREVTSKRSRIHGHASNQNRIAQTGRCKSTEYSIWRDILGRCYNPNRTAYPDYGGRGITVCDRWRFGEDGKTGFECFLADVGSRPNKRLTLDRIDNHDGYKPRNVRWATSKQQNRNSRKNKLVSLFDVGPICVTEAVEYWGQAPVSAVYARLKRGWSDEDAVLTPSGEKRAPGMEVCF